MCSEWISICFRRSPMLSPTANRGIIAILMIRISGCSETVDPMAKLPGNGHLEREEAIQRRFIFLLFLHVQCFVFLLHRMGME